MGCGASTKYLSPGEHQPKTVDSPGLEVGAVASRGHAKSDCRSEAAPTRCGDAGVAANSANPQDPHDPSGHIPVGKPFPAGASPNSTDRGDAAINAVLIAHGYAPIKRIGVGTYGSAFLVQRPSESDEDVRAVVKMVDIHRANTHERKDALKESQVLSSLKHPFIVNYLETFEQDGWLCIAMDFCEGGDLFLRIKKQKRVGGSFSRDRVLRWFTQAILALKYIHDRHILHRDLKSSNIFLTRYNNVALGDFGIATVLECSAAFAQTKIGTPAFMSPEICSGVPYAFGCDVWSMGCILYEMCAKEAPFRAANYQDLVLKITAAPIPVLPTEYVDLQPLSAKLLDRNPALRPTATQILKEPLVAETRQAMLAEVQSKQETPASAADGAAAAAAPAATYVKDQPVEYLSVSHGAWLACCVSAVDDEGRIMLSVKPNVWLSLDVQAERVRPPLAPQTPQVAGAEAPSFFNEGNPEHL